MLKGFFFLLFSFSVGLSAMDKAEQVHAGPSHKTSLLICSFLDVNSLLAIRMLGKKQADFVEEAFGQTTNMGTPLECLISHKTRVYPYPHTASYGLRKKMKEALSLLHLFRINNRKVKKDPSKAQLFLGCACFCEEWGHLGQRLFSNAYELFEKGKSAFNVDDFECGLSVKFSADEQEIRMMIMIEYLTQNSLQYSREESLAIAKRLKSLGKQKMAHFYVSQLEAKLEELKFVNQDNTVEKEKWNFSNMPFPLYPFKPSGKQSGGNKAEAPSQNSGLWPKKIDLAF